MGLPKDSGLELHSKWPKGKLNLITDVPGVKVANVTIQDGKEVNTGVTAILPHTGDIFHDKVMAGVSVINGFGKSLGLVQIDELGTIETPIVMTNTLSVGTAAEALQQIEEKGYAREYAADARKLYKIGASFSSETGTIGEWQVV